MYQTCAWPRETGLLETPMEIAGTDIMVVRPYDGRRIRKALLDFDGTLSREREGWINLMVACNLGALCQAVDDTKPEEALEWVIGDIEKTIGVPTYTQMRRLADEIRRRGGEPKEPGEYKGVYTSLLGMLVRKRHDKMESGTLYPSDLQVTGSTHLLSNLAARIGSDSMYIASGTDIGPVLESVRRLGYDKFFGEQNIVAAGSSGDPEQCAKQMVIERLAREQNLQPGELLCIGDGFPEVLYTYHAGGICVGVVTPDKSNYRHLGHFTPEKKRDRLVRAGAHILVPHFLDSEELVNTIFSAQP